MLVLDFGTGEFREQQLSRGKEDSPGCSILVSQGQPWKEKINAQSFSVSSGHWERIFQELLCPSKAAVSAVHRLGGPVSTTRGPVHAGTGTGT